jgi:hypothetical protein
MLRDLYSNLKVIAATVAAPTDTTAVASPIVDARDYQEVLFVVMTGTLGDADATFAAVMAESANSNMSSSNAVADEDMIGLEADVTFDFADDNFEGKIGYIGDERYVQLTVTPTGNASAAPITILALGVPHRFPAA